MCALPQLIFSIRVSIGPQFVHTCQGGTACPGWWLGSGFSEERSDLSKGSSSLAVPFPYLQLLLEGQTCSTIIYCASFWFWSTYYSLAHFYKISALDSTHTDLHNVYVDLLVKTLSSILFHLAFCSCLSRQKLDSQQIPVAVYPQTILLVCFPSSREVALSVTSVLPMKPLQVYSLLPQRHVHCWSCDKKATQWLWFQQYGNQWACPFKESNQEVVNEIDIIFF